MNKRSRDFLISSFRYFILVSAVYFALRQSWIFEFQISYRTSTKIDLNVFLWPLLTIIPGFYLGRLSQYLLTGRWVEPIKNSLRYAGITGFIYLLISSPQAPDGLRITSNIFIIGVGAMIILYLMENTIGQSYPLLKSTTRSLRYLSFGVSLGLIIERIPEIPIPGLDSGFIILGILTSTTAFLRYFKESPFRVLSTIGELVSRRQRLTIISMAIISFYASTYRGLLIRNLEQSSGFVYLFEWASVCIIAYQFFRRINKSMRSRVSDLKGNWIKHVQKVETRSDSELEKWTRLIEGFKDDGEKNLLILYLFDLLRKNGVPLEQIQVDLSELMEWSEKDANIGLVFNEAQRSRRLRDKREAVLDHVIERVQVKIGG